jgi:hypothetical protein
MGQLGNLGPPDYGDIRRLRHELALKGGNFKLDDGLGECWDEENDDDLIALRSGDGKSHKLMSTIRFHLDIMHWKLWGYGNVSHQHLDFCH